MLTREIYSKGQVVIPKNLRDILGIRPHMRVSFEIDGNAIKIKKVASVVESFERIARTKGLDLSKIDLDALGEEEYEERFSRVE